MNRVTPVRSREALGHGIYTVKASHQLPVINAKKTLKSAWLSASACQLYHKIVRRWRTQLIGSLMMAALLTMVTVVAPAPVACIVAPLVPPLGLPPMLISLLSVRYDMAARLLRTFDLWYRGLIVGIGFVAFAFHFNDIRALALLPGVAGNLLVLLTDARLYQVKSQFVLYVAGGLVQLLVAVSVACEWIDAVKDATALQVYDHRVTVRSIVVNSYGLSSLLYFHSAFVQRSYAKTKSASHSLTTTTQCVLYRCRLQWQPTNLHSRLAIGRRDVKRQYRAEIIQLRCTSLHYVINARTTLVRASPQTQLRPFHCLLRLVLLLNGVVGFVAMMATFATVAHGGAQLSSPTVYTLSTISFATTVSVNAFFLAFVYQVEILRLLYTSFDFVFNFGQIFFAHVCLCDLSAWDVRVFAIISSLLWIHWACVIDTIPPVKRVQLGLNVRRVAAVIHVAFLLGFVLLSIDLISWHSQHFVNRDVLSDIGDRDSRRHHSANWSVGSFFLHRVPGIVVWSGRLVSHILTYAEDDLVSLRGRVGFDDYEASRRMQRKESMRAQLSAIILSLSGRSLGREVSEVSERADTTGIGKLS